MGYLFGIIQAINWSAVLGFLFEVVLLVVVIVLGMQLIKFLEKITRNALLRANAEAGVISFLCALEKYSLYVILGFMILSKFGITASSVVAVLGSAGLTLGLALQGSLSNFAGGVLILVTKPFVVGDYIMETASNTEGTVVEISLIYTKLTTPDNKCIMVPNGALAANTIVNYSSMDKRRVDIVVGVAYNSDLAKVKAVLSEVMEQEKAFLEEEPKNVFVSELGESAVQMGIRGWVKNEEYWETTWRLNESIKDAFDKNSIEIPFPQLNVTVKK